MSLGPWTICACSCLREFSSWPGYFLSLACDLSSWVLKFHLWQFYHNGQNIVGGNKMTRVEELVKQIEDLTFEEQKILFDLLADTLDNFGWLKLNDIKLY
ncbi:hypothetical protein Dred_1276 [Desulforamulus reducens MI-1]|uniref:Uncharacterized protein n=1 Tax=Desulforamulus reducens (strain ATCC BAA-1160 / DSM 100696 / MI-1) TaxID=349161 RepID=A4J407_DESRM|nr:hypothetical protein Dred_1276 [Desulforamulus reducens MI-1]